MQDTLQVKERQYSNNVKILQEAANVLQEKLSIKHEVKYDPFTI